jgi:hypothetical protein
MRGKSEEKRGEKSGYSLFKHDEEWSKMPLRPILNFQLLHIHV